MTNHLPSCLKLETTDVCGLQLCFQGHNSGRSQPVARVNTNLADLCSNGFGSCRTTNGGPCPHDPERPLAVHFRFGEKMLIIHCCFESGDHHFVKRSHHFSKKNKPSSKAWSPSSWLIQTWVPYPYQKVDISMVRRRVVDSPWRRWIVESPRRLMSKPRPWSQELDSSGYGITMDHYGSLRS